MMKDKDLQRLKQRHFGKAAARSGIPLEYYELPAVIIEAEEQRLAAEAQRKAEAQRRKKEARKKLNPTRGEVSFQRLVRREVGDY